MQAPKMTMKSLLSIAVLAMLVSACGNETTPEQASQKEEIPADPNLVVIGPQLKSVVAIGPVENMEIKDTLRISGRIQVNEQHEARVGAALTGRISELKVALGDEVKQGQVLAKIKSTELAQYQLTYIKAKQQTQLLSKAVERAKLLLTADVISPAELQRREVEYQAAVADLNASKEQLIVLGMTQDGVNKLSTSNYGMSESLIFSRITGTVIQRKARIGEVVAPAEDLFIIADLSKVWAVAEVPEQQIAHLRMGQRVDIEVPALKGKLLEGEISFIGDIVNPETRTVMARASLDNSDRQLKPDMLISILLESSASKVPAIPETAVVREDNRDYVFVQTKKDHVTLREIQLGDPYNGQLPIENGIAVGEIIVKDGAFHVNNERKRKEME